MSVGSAVMAGRAAAEARMFDACVVMELGAPETDDEGNVTVPGVVAYSGKCRLQTYEPYEKTPEAGGAVSTVQRYSLHLPAESFAPDKGQVIEITAARYDANLIGRQYRVTGLLHKSQATAYRLLVDEYVGETIVWDDES